MLLEVQTIDADAQSGLLTGPNSPAPADVQIKLTETKAGRDGGATILIFLLTIGKDVAVGVVASWLYDRLKGHASKIRLNGKAIAIDKPQIESALKS
jgi:hypothetical protein